VRYVAGETQAYADPPLGRGVRSLARVVRSLDDLHASRLADVVAYHVNERVMRRSYGRTARARLRSGVEMVLPMRDHGMRKLALAGRYEPEVEALARAVLRPGDIAIDAGANVGVHTLLFALLVGPGGHVHAIEPAGEPRALLERSLELNGYSRRVTVHPCALSDTPGTAMLHLDPSVGLMNTLDGTRRIGSRTVSVPVDTLDSRLLPSLDRAPRLLKLDVEGAELRIVAGASSLFHRMAPQVVIAEVSSIEGSTHLEAAMEAHGYVPASLSSGCVTSDASARPLRATGGRPDDPNFRYENRCFVRMS
jgi:FkbM family methyltransferase